MMFGITLSWQGWLIVLAGALMALLVPFMVTDYITSIFPSLLKGITMALLNFIGVPALMCYVHHRKMLNKGRGSVFFFAYSIMFSLLALMTLLQLFSHFSFMALLGTFITVPVAAGMIWFAFKTKATLTQTHQDNAHALREDDINRQTEAILRADDIKKQRESAATDTTT